MDYPLIKTTKTEVEKVNLLHEKFLAFKRKREAIQAAKDAGNIQGREGIGT